MKMYIISFRGMYVNNIVCGGVSTQTKLGEGLIAFETVRDAKSYALNRGISPRYFKELKYIKVEVTLKKKGTKK